MRTIFHFRGHDRRDSFNRNDRGNRGNNFNNRGRDTGWAKGGSWGNVQRDVSLKCTI